ncbi:hypothetical protein BJY04DRAFT_197069 [Aspergillus karnatakaensis]|uniref:uncharacterized protein n=1 Tax=Aspergillus karnatakaensis TaxID=1810916 RepID=UPI003CCE51D2
MEARFMERGVIGDHRYHHEVSGNSNNSGPKVTPAEHDLLRTFTTINGDRALLATGRATPFFLEDWASAMHHAGKFIWHQRLQSRGSRGFAMQSRSRKQPSGPFSHSIGCMLFISTCRGQLTRSPRSDSGEFAKIKYGGSVRVVISPIFRLKCGNSMNSSWYNVGVRRRLSKNCNPG